MQISPVGKIKKMKNFKNSENEVLAVENGRADSERFMEEMDGDETLLRDTGE